MDLPVVDTTAPGFMPHLLAVHQDEAASWRIGILNFMAEVDELVARGRIDSDARNVIFCKLKRTVPLTEIAP